MYVAVSRFCFSGKLRSWRRGLWKIWSFRAIKSEKSFKKGVLERSFGRSLTILMSGRIKRVR